MARHSFWRVDTAGLLLKSFAGCNRDRIKGELSVLGLAQGLFAGFETKARYIDADGLRYFSKNLP